MHKLLILFCSLFLLNSAISQNIEIGTYISYKRGLLAPKYAILFVHEDSSQFEMFTHWQGAWIPAIGASKDGYQPQTLIMANNVLSNENVRVEKSQNLKGLIKNSFVGKVRLNFKMVDELPDEFIEIKQKSIDFIKQEQNK